MITALNLTGSTRARDARTRANGPSRRARRDVLAEELERRTLFASGAADLTFGRGGAAGADFAGAALDLLVLPGGKLLAVGSGGGDVALARFNADGSPDTSFGGDGKVTTDFGGDSGDV